MNSPDTPETERALTIDQSRFPSEDELARWRRSSQFRGPCPAGSAAHDAYTQHLADHLARLGIRDVRLEDVVTDTAATRNIVAVIPGTSDELVVLQAHTDVSERTTRRGPDTLLAVASYLAATPRAELPRGFLVLLTVEDPAAVASFHARHAEDLVPRIAVTVPITGPARDTASQRRRVIELTAAVLDLAQTSWARLRSRPSTR
jgi:hypothetical protein